MLKLHSANHHYNASTVVNLPDLQVNNGEELLVLGMSGSGKSTLLHVLAGLLNPTNGQFSLNGTLIYDMSEGARDRYRGKNIGIVFQQMHLIRTLNVIDNLKLAQYMCGLKPDSYRIKKLCSDLDISKKLDSYPEELSQGQKQRVSIARAVVNKPVLMLADEPTSSLDDVRSKDVILLLKDQAKKTGATLIVSTHDQRVKKHFSNVINLDDLQTKVAADEPV